MRARALEEPKNYQIKDIPVPEMKENEVLVRVLISEICVNDVRDYQGCKRSYPRTGGHEHSAAIEYIRTGADPSLFHIGGEVIDYTIDDCRACPDCKRRHENICNNFTKGTAYFNENGFSGFCGSSEYAVVKAYHLYMHPKGTPDDGVASTEPLAYVINSINRSHIKMGDDVVVIGDGVTGLLHVPYAKRQGARVILSEMGAKRRVSGLRLGTDNAVDPLEFGPVKQVKKLTNGRGANIVENTIAIPSVAAQTVQMTTKSGLCNMFSSIHPDEPILADTGHLHSQGIVVTGTQNGAIETFAQVVDCTSKGVIDVKLLIEVVYDHEGVVEAMECAGRPDTYKVIPCFSE